MKKGICVLMMVGAVLGGCAADQPAGEGPPLCPVHQVPLQSGTAQIRPGLFDHDPLAEERRSGFPCARTWVQGGCVVEADRTVEVCFCLICREAEAAAVAERAARHTSTDAAGH